MHVWITETARIIIMHIHCSLIQYLYNTELVVWTFVLSDVSIKPERDNESFSFKFQTVIKTDKKTAKGQNGNNFNFTDI